MFDALGAACRRDGYRGCAFINTAAEAVPGSAVHARAVAHNNDVRESVRGLATEAGVVYPGGLSRSLVLLLDGGLAAGALAGGPTSADAARAAARVLVAAATPAVAAATRGQGGRTVSRPRR
jgi:hypothetical protein